jgi:hypothetical protein
VEMSNLVKLKRMKNKKVPRFLPALIIMGWGWLFLSSLIIPLEVVSDLMPIHIAEE